MIAEGAPLRVGMLFALPFRAWPLAWRLGGWGVVAAVVAVAVQACCVQAGRGGAQDGAAAAEARVLARIAAAERRTARLPALRARADQLARPGRPAPGTGAPGARDVATAADVPDDAAVDGASSAALLGWIEQSVLASRVSLLAFEPIATFGAQTMWGVAASHTEGPGTDGTDADAWRADKTDGDALDNDASDIDEVNPDAADVDVSSGAASSGAPSAAGTRNPGMPGSRKQGVAPWRARAARLRVEGNYPQVRDLLERLARTRPALLIDAATLRAAGGTLSLTLRFRTLEPGDFTLRPAPPRRSGDAALANPFARRRLPDATGAARLLGTFVSGRRRAALLALQQATCFVEIGGTVGDARVQAIGRDSATLAPLADGVSRTLRLRE
ncbi:MAG: hypothetical protein ACRYHA_18865 [Janthinobacterium lividum]